MTEELDPLAQRDGIVVRRLDDTADLDRALELLDAAEAATGVELVDEAERRRLQQLAVGDSPRDGRWHSVLAWSHGRPVGYGAVVLASSGSADGDVAVDRRAAAPAAREALQALLAATRSVARRHGAEPLQIWTRHVGPDELDAAAAEGFVPQRRLAVMGRTLDDLPGGGSSGAAHVRGYRPDEDDEAVVAVLAAAYGGTEEAGWDLDRFRERTRLPWFRAEDLLVAELPGDQGAPPIAGLHWLKRRSRTVGEVYNLAIHPDAQGRALGPVLLSAGLAHLREIGCDEVLLWVDLANVPAVRLYRGQGFETRWQDVALGPSDA